MKTHKKGDFGLLLMLSPHYVALFRSFYQSIYIQCADFMVQNDSVYKALVLKYSIIPFMIVLILSFRITWIIVYRIKAMD